MAEREGETMKYFIMLIVAVLLAVVVNQFARPGKPDEYAMTAEQAHELLNSAKLQPSSEAPFGRLETKVSSESDTSVAWSAAGAHASMRCDMTIIPVKTKLTRIAVSCDGDGSASSANKLANDMLVTLVRNAVIENVDAILKGRPYNSTKAMDGVTAARWPADVIERARLDEFFAAAPRANADARRRFIAGLRWSIEGD